MPKQIPRLPTPSMAVALVALFVALGGTGYAATTLIHSPKARIAKKAANDTKADTALVKKLAPSLHVAFAGTAGSANHANSADTATSASSANHATSADSATSATHATSADTATSADSALSATTATTASAPGTLPAGKTETGVYSLGCEVTASTGEDCAEGESFAFPLPEASVPATYIQAGQTPPSACPGTVAAPAAASGQLCVYEAGHFGQFGTLRSVFDPSTSGPTPGQANRHGFGVFSDGSGTAGTLIVWGTWAVTG